MFIDVTNVELRAGNGGNGAVAFRREKFEPAGGPAGGDGGDGGSIVIQADEGMRTLLDFRYQHLYKAEHGENGRNKKQFGKMGEDLILRVPVGTLVKDVETGRVIVDIKDKDQSFVIAKGGKGGKGNARFATSTRQAPRFAEPGTKGEELKVTLELKLLADVGLVGFPNVGKSTLLSVVSEAKPKIANYHFTTLEPNLGVVNLGDGNNFVMADIPGLIEGAHEGIGLGHDFLRHVERNRVLVHVVDASGVEGRDPLEDFNSINNELKKYDERLGNKPQILVANKMDIPGAEEGLETLKEALAGEIEIFPISAATNKGTKELKAAIWKLLENTPIEEMEYETYDEDFVEGDIEEKPEVIVRKENGKYILEGSLLERLMDTTNFDDYDSSRYFQNAVRRSGAVEKLRELGIQEEDVVYICGYEFEFFE